MDKSKTSKKNETNRAGSSYEPLFTLDDIWGVNEAIIKYKKMKSGLSTNLKKNVNERNLTNQELNSLWKKATI